MYDKNNSEVVYFFLIHCPPIRLHKTEGMERDDKTLDYTEYEESDEGSDQEESQAEPNNNSEMSENDSKNSLVKSNFVLPDPGKDW